MAIHCCYHLYDSLLFYSVSSTNSIIISDYNRLGGALGQSMIYWFAAIFNGSVKWEKLHYRGAQLVGDSFWNDALNRLL